LCCKIRWTIEIICFSFWIWKQHFHARKLYESKLHWKYCLLIWFFDDDKLNVFHLKSIIFSACLVFDPSIGCLLFYPTLFPKNGKVQNICFHTCHFQHSFVEWNGVKIATIMSLAIDILNFWLFDVNTGTFSTNEMRSIHIYLQAFVGSYMDL